MLLLMILEMIFVIIGVLTSHTNQAQIDEDGIRESLMQHLGFLSTPNMEKVSCKCKSVKV